jgi:hypothetical protein
MLDHVSCSLFPRNSHFFVERDLGRKFGAMMVQTKIRSDHGKKSYKLSKAKTFKKFALFFSHTPKKRDFFYALSCFMLAFSKKFSFFCGTRFGRKFGAMMVQTLIVPTSPFLIRSDHGKKSNKLSKAKTFKKFALFSSHTPRKRDFFYALSCFMLAFSKKFSFFCRTRSW